MFSFLLLSTQMKAAVSSINTAVFPDNVVEGDCYVYVEDSFEWGMQLDQISTQSANRDFTPVAGDLDNDGISEIVTVSNNDVFASIAVYQGDDVENSILIPLNTTLNNAIVVPIGLLRIPNKLSLSDTIGLIIVRTDTDIRSYKYNAYNDITLFKINSINVPLNGAVSFADFNNDGIIECFCGDMIFDAFSLDLIAEGTGNSGNSFFGKFQEKITVAADVLPSVAGTELVCGAEIYSVNFTTHTLQLEKSILPSSAYKSDGHTAVADFNNDGVLDVLVKHDSDDSYGIYAYDPVTSVLLFEKIVHNVNPYNYPQISDLDGDNIPEIIVLTENNLEAYKINGLNLNHFWSFQVTENSGCTAVAIFDFNQDGINEIVFRDQKFLRVIDGSTSSPIELLLLDKVSSNTFVENCIVLDCDGDGEAEILTIATDQYFEDFTYSKLRVYKSSKSRWAPARKVWNQYNYNVTNVNNDLTIPSYLFNNASFFSNGTQPFNNTFTQATLIKANGDPVFQANNRKYVSLTENACDSYLFVDNLLTTSALYKDTILTTAGCDSIISLDLTINSSYYIDKTITLHCDETYSVNGNIYRNSGLYTEHMITHKGCDSTIVTNVLRDFSFCPKVEVQFFFSPNGDGVNDYFEIKNILFYPKAFVEIYDRYSRLLYYFKSNEKGWDGVYNGKNMPSTDYWYILEIPEIKFRKLGHFLLKR